MALKAKYISTFELLFKGENICIYGQIENNGNIRIKDIDCEINKIFTDKVLTNGDNINNIYTIRGTEINSAFLKTKG